MHATQPANVSKFRLASTGAPLGFCDVLPLAGPSLVASWVQFGRCFYHFAVTRRVFSIEPSPSPQLPFRRRPRGRGMNLAGSHCRVHRLVPSPCTQERVYLGSRCRVGTTRWMYLRPTSRLSPLRHKGWSSRPWERTTRELLSRLFETVCGRS